MRSSPDGYVEAPIPETDHEAPDYKADLTPAKIMLGRRLFFYVWLLSDSLIAAGAPVKLRHGSVVAM
jgi:hypothetical protein